MAGLLPVATSFAAPRLHLGYRRIRLVAPSPLGQGGTTYRGHEFHYASLLQTGGAPPLFDVSDALGQPLGPSGAQVGTTAGSFLHLIDRAADQTDDLGRAGRLRVVGS
jgi:cobyrinic acid a,c-diamide synthase